LRVAPALAALAALALGGAAGCGGGSAVEPADGARQPGAGEGGTIAIAIAAEPSGLDPLLAADRSSALVTRQVHEPLVETLSGPFGDERRLPGLAKAYRPSRDRTIWQFELRDGVRFQDGAPFNASAVLANAERWQSRPESRELLPSLVAVDAPRPDLVRFVLSVPDPDFPRRLADGRLGIVSPRALGPGEGAAARLARADRTGTGPFELRDSDPGIVRIVHNVGWWGERLGLGPAVDQIELPVVPDDRERLDLLLGSEVQAADELDRETLRALSADPLVTYAGDGPYLGFERSIRGLEDPDPVPLLSAVWVTTVGGAG
jgi:peptide/nickel transport system substrate-binding protein